MTREIQRAVSCAVLENLDSLSRFVTVTLFVSCWVARSQIGLLRFCYLGCYGSCNGCGPASSPGREAGKQSFPPRIRVSLQVASLSRGARNQASRSSAQGISDRDRSFRSAGGF